MSQFLLAKKEQTVSIARFDKSQQIFIIEYLIFLYISMQSFLCLYVQNLKILTKCFILYFDCAFLKMCT